MLTQHHDILIIGAGLSGVGAACHFSRNCPQKSVAILERRQAMGGTWDLFRYPGIRSDSDMFTFGYSFRPWTESRVLADGPSIKRYMIDTAQEFGVDKKIRYGRHVVSADFATKTGLWTVVAKDEASGELENYTANFFMVCTGYYNYDSGFRPAFANEKAFKGEIIHPQFWPENLDYDGKRVVIIGSGATAITLLPKMTDKAAHVTMLQRSPTYIMSVPAIDPVARALQKFLPEKAVYRINRIRNIGLQRLLFQFSRKRPAVVRRMLLRLVKKQLAGSGIDMKHFTPSYQPWDQRLCVVPNGDFFRVLREGKASIATDHIENFTKTGILLKSGEEIPADIIISATGLNIQMAGGMAITVDDTPAPMKSRLTYKGVLVEGVPNAAVVFGYTNASWTLKVDLASEYMCRLVNFMDEKGYRTVEVHDQEDLMTEDTVLGSLSSGYIQRAADQLPRQGSKAPFRVVQDYLRDLPLMRYKPIDDGYLQFDGQPARAPSSLSRITAPFKAALGLG
jgi:cation diffusion facilitator CzcD-associated flavoprotein CzcO